MLWKKIKRYFPFIGIILFIYLLIRLKIGEIFKQVLEANKLYLLIALVLVLFYLFFQTLKWHVLARKQKIPIPFQKSFKINLISNFYGLVTPGKLGTIIRAEYLKKYSNSGKGLSNFVIDKVLSLISLFFMVLLLGFIVLREKLDWFNGLTLIYGISIFFLLIAMFLFFYNKERSKSLLKVVYRKLIPQKMKEKARGTFNSFYEDLPKKRLLLEVFILNLISWLVCYIVVYFVALSLSIEIKFIYFIAIYPIATLVAQIPITISGLGTREVTLIGLFGLFGVEAVKVFSMSLIGLFIMAVFPSLIAIFFILKERKKNEIHKIEQGR
ncbi:flippase-like domain-containing protein [Candidatus Pacearchaeota archaeon]|nr:flippase-like domain-containing protein [Candidatus Pacearchaeota archaeon]